MLSARVAELVYALDLKSSGLRPCGFESRPGHHNKKIMKNKFTPIILLASAVIIFAPSLVYAHTGIGQTAGFWHGFSHPLGGLDHILAMLAVGIWAAQVGGKAVWAVPATFVSVMIIGGILGITGITIPFVRSEERRVGKECRSRWSQYH